MSKRIFVLAGSIVIWAITFYPSNALAGASVSVSPTTWAIGTKQATASATSSAYTITNNSTGTEDIQIYVGNSTSGWSPSTTSSNGVNTFVLQLTNSGGQVIKSSGSPYTLATGLAANGTYNLTLYFTTPSSASSGTSGEGVQQTITVTLTALNWIASCAGTPLDGACWYSGPIAQSCPTTCTSHGGLASPQPTVSQADASTLGAGIWSTTCSANGNSNFYPFLWSTCYTCTGTATRDLDAYGGNENAGTSWGGATAVLCACAD